MKRILSSSTTRRKNKFSYSNHRKGKVYFDNIEVYDKTYSYDDLTDLADRVCDMNFIFDTLAHMNYAAYADSEEWTPEDVADAVGDSIDVKELMDTWNASAIQHISEIPNDCIKCYVTLTVYGVGNKKVKIYTTIYGEPISHGSPLTFDYSGVTTLFDKHSYIRTEPQIYPSVTPSPNQLKMLIREVVKYITAGL